MSKLFMNFNFFLIISVLSLTVTYHIELKEYYNKDNLVKDNGTVSWDDSVTSKQVIEEGHFGWNLGNTLDAYNLDTPKQNEGLNSERLWGQPYTTDDIVKGVKKKGFGTIRIPVTWHNHLIDENYTIDPKWMQRVKTVVDYGIKNGLYVILNVHHDNPNFYNNTLMPYGLGYYPFRKDIVESEKYIYNIWKQIVAAFNNGYDHHLILETFNEPRPVGTECEWQYQKGNAICDEAVSVINEYIKLAHQVIRESGGNNAKRFIMVSTLGAQIWGTIDANFILPNDKKYNPTNTKIIISTHMYLPWGLCQSTKTSPSVFTIDDSHELEHMFKQLYEKYVLRGYHVIIGETGCINKRKNIERINWGKFFIETARKYQINTCIWDARDPNQYGHYNRPNLTWYFDDIIDAYVAAGKTKLVDNPFETYDKNFIKEPVLFYEWKNTISLDYMYFQSFNSYNKLVFTKTVVNDTDGSVKLNYYDWKGTLVFTEEDLQHIKGCKLGYAGKSLVLLKDSKTIEIGFTKEQLEICKTIGIILGGVKFIVDEIHISGPRVTQISPLKIQRAKEEQEFHIYFSEDASVLNGKVFFRNFYYDINNQIDCKVKEEDKSHMICKGIFNFTGEYYLEDDNGLSLFDQRYLTVVPKLGNNPNINNLLDTQVLFDDTTEIKVSIPKEKLSDINLNSDSKLILEIEDLHYERNYKTLSLYQGTGSTIIKFESSLVNTTVNKNGSLVVPSAPNRELIEINLKKNYQTIKDNGFTIKGYGFLLRNSFFNEKIDIENKDKDSYNDDSSGSSGLTVFLIIFLCIILFGGGFIAFRIIKKRNNVEYAVNSNFSKNEKMLV